MFANRMREQVEAAKKRERDNEETKLKTRYLDTRLELKQNFFEKSMKEEVKAEDSPEKQARSPAKRLVVQDEVERKRFVSGDGEASFFNKSSPRRSLSSDACVHDTAAKKDLEQTTRRHSSPEVTSRR